MALCVVYSIAVLLCKQSKFAMMDAEPRFGAGQRSHGTTSHVQRWRAQVTPATSFDMMKGAELTKHGQMLVVVAHHGLVIWLADDSSAEHAVLGSTRSYCLSDTGPKSTSLLSVTDCT